MHKGLAGMLSDTGLKDIADNKNDADCTKAIYSGLRYQVSSFEFIATVELLFYIFEPIDIYKRLLQAGNRRMLAMWHITMFASRQWIREAHSGGHCSKCQELPCAAAVYRSDQNLQSFI